MPMQMDPTITLLTSEPFQRDILMEEDSPEEMDELKQHRDDAVDRLAAMPDVLESIEDASGLLYNRADMQAWMYRGRDNPVISPMLIPMRQDTETELFDLVYILSHQIFLQNLRNLKEHDMLEPGFEKMDVTAGMLAYRVLADAEGEEFVQDVLESSEFGGKRLKTWRKVKEQVQDWDEDKSLLDHLGIEKTEEQKSEEEKAKELADKL